MLFLPKGSTEVAMGLGAAIGVPIGVPIGGGLQEVRNFLHENLCPG